MWNKAAVEHYNWWFCISCSCGESKSSDCEPDAIQHSESTGHVTRVGSTTQRDIVPLKS